MRILYLALVALVVSCASSRIRDFSQISLDPGMWIPANQISDFDVQDGVMKGVASGEDPFLVIDGIRLKGRDVRLIKVRIKADFGSRMSLYWNASADSGWSERRTVKVNITSDGEYHSYILPVGLHEEWREKTIRSIRLDPSEGDQGGIFEIAWIKAQ